MLVVMQHQESMIHKVQVIAGMAQVQNPSTGGRRCLCAVTRSAELPRKRSMTLTAMQCHGSVDSSTSELISVVMQRQATTIWKIQKTEEFTKTDEFTHADPRMRLWMCQ